jgi:tetratricopeptide (TPR) repeat protein
MRDAAYEGLPFRRRRELHARAGVMIVAAADEPMDEAEVLSHHFFQAHSHFDAWAYSRIAGERAVAKYANADAAVFFARALESGRRARIPRDELALVFEELGDVRMLLNEFDGARAAYASGRRIVDDSVTQARFLLAEAKVHGRAGRYADAIRSLRRGLRLLEGDYTPEAERMRARVSALYAGIRVAQGKYAEAEAWCRRILDDVGEVGELEALARAYYILDFVFMDQGRVDEAVYSGRAAELYEQLGDLPNQAEVISNSGADAYERGDWDEAIELYERALALKRRLGDDAEAAICESNIAEIWLDQGHVAQAEGLLRRAARAARAGSYLVPQAAVTGLLARVSMTQGRFDAAAAELDAARSLFERVGHRPQVFEMRVRLAEMYVLKGDGAAALEEAERSAVVAAELGGVPARLPLLHRVRAFALVELGRLAEARAALAASLDAGRARKSLHEVALTLAALVELDRLEGLEPHPDAVRESTEILDRLGVVAYPPLPAPATALA